MILEQTADLPLIKQILTDDYIWERAAEDGVDKDDFYPGVDSNTNWLLCIDDGDLCGVILVHIETSCCLAIHPYLYKEHRRKGRDMIASLFKLFCEQSPKEFVKINCVIPDCFKSAQNFAERVGFTQEGVSRMSYLKAGEVYDRKMYGITRKEIELLCQQ